MVLDPETRKTCKRQVFLFEQLMIFSEPFERKLDWTVYIYRHSIKVIRPRLVICKSPCLLLSVNLAEEPPIPKTVCPLL